MFLIAVICSGRKCRRRESTEWRLQRLTYFTRTQVENEKMPQRFTGRMSDMYNNWYVIKGYVYVMYENLVFFVKRMKKTFL